MTAGTGPPVRVRLTPLGWVRANLFGSPLNSLMTIVFGAVLGLAAWRALRLVFVTARWEVVRRNLTNFMVGAFPREDLWRVWVALLVLSFAIGFQLGVAHARRLADPSTADVQPLGVRGVSVRIWPLLVLAGAILLLSPAPVTALMMAGLGGATALGRVIGVRTSGFLGRRSWLMPAAAIVGSFVVVSRFGGVPFGRWQGLLLTVSAAAGGIVLSFPIGVALALGRRSTLPAVRVISIGYIELIRGVPLITLLFMAFLMLRLFLPPGSPAPSTAIRGLVALVAFTAAYIAEIVRGGLQSVPKGQVEAAQALGLGQLTIIRRIVLPQALRAVIPAIVGQFISLFKDTSLLGFIGLIELLGIAQQVTAQPDFLGQGLQAETLMFASVVYWSGAYWLSKSSQRLEKRLGIGER